MKITLIALLATIKYMTLFKNGYSLLNSITNIVFNSKNLNIRQLYFRSSTFPLKNFQN